MHEKGIADHFDETIYDMTPVGEQRGWKHLKMNAWGETPTLSLADGSFLSETSAIARYLDDTFDGRKLMGETTHERGLDQMWDNRVWVHILYPIVTAFHVLHQGLGPKLELTSNPAWGEHQGRADACWSGRSASLRWPRVAARRRSADLLRHHVGDGHRVLEVPGQRHPSRRALRAYRCLLAALAAASDVPRRLCRSQQRCAGTR
ncbi:glutathione S-transferase [Bradyrhizobium sp. I1.7.5]